MHVPVLICLFVRVYGISISFCMCVHTCNSICLCADTLVWVGVNGCACV